MLKKSSMGMGVASRVLHRVRSLLRLEEISDAQLLLSGKICAELVKSKNRVRSLHDVEFKVFSQFGDDGILQWLTNKLDIPNKTFVEFGVADYRESNTRFLMMNDNWSGMVMDGSDQNVARITNSEYYWRHDLSAKHAFIDRQNINALLRSSAFDPQLGLLHIDLDGNDYWIWKEIEGVAPIILILEYNSVFGIDKPLTIPYEPAFTRGAAHYSNLYWGASLRALYELSLSRGYAFVGCNSAGNNSYFVRRDKLNDCVSEVSLEHGFVVSKFRESRDRHGQLSYLAGPDRRRALTGMPIFNVSTGELEQL